MQFKNTQKDMVLLKMLINYHMKLLKQS